MYSPQFVASVFQKLRICDNDWILDPWNGIGTTTSVAWRLGLNAVGLDINPAMVMIAKGRLLQHADVSRLSELGKTIERIERPPYSDPSEADPLNDFFVKRSVGFVRGVERVLQRNIDAQDNPDSRDTAWVERCSPLLACLYVALFRGVRKIFGVFDTSNPTWFKKPVPGNRASFSWECFKRLIVEGLFDALGILQADYGVLPVEPPDVHVALGDSRHIQLPRETVSLTITSPPYCTRIDYAVATLPELMVLRA
jgi:hypothetical protein